MGLANHLVVFARTPRVGGVKRRLGRDIGPVAAWRFYGMTLHRLLHRLAGGPWQCWLFVTPDRDAVSGFGPVPAAWRLCPQGRGDLGERMQRALATPPPGPVVLVGSDVPDIRRAHIEAAFRQLGRAETVFGPAADGGFWLVGARRRPVLPPLFADVRWSGPDALSDTLANLQPRHSHAFVETLADVDDGAAWRRWRQSRSQ